MVNALYMFINILNVKRCKSSQNIYFNLESKYIFYILI